MEKLLHWQLRSFHPLLDMHLEILPRRSILGTRHGNFRYTFLVSDLLFFDTFSPKSTGPIFANMFQVFVSSSSGLYLCRSPAWTQIALQVCESEFKELYYQRCKDCIHFV
jgi:hypothetical protein